MTRQKTLWERDDIQFPRLLAEIAALGLTKHQQRDLAISMDLELGELDELLKRAQAKFERIKARHCKGTMYSINQDKAVNRELEITLRRKRR